MIIKLISASSGMVKMHLVACCMLEPVAVGGLGALHAPAINIAISAGRIGHFELYDSAPASVRWLASQSDFTAQAMAAVKYIHKTRSHLAVLVVPRMLWFCRLCSSTRIAN